MKTKRLRAGLCFNLKMANGGSDDDEEYDEIETIDFLEEQLIAVGFDVIRYEQDEQLFQRLGKDRPDFVLNIAEGRGKTRNRESQVPAVLDWLNIPHYGSDAVAMGVTLDKFLTQAVLKSAGIPVPHLYLCYSPADVAVKNIDWTDQKYIVKPRWEGSSKGVFPNSVVSSPQECQERVGFVVENYQQAAVVEEFLVGAEVTVAVIGNRNPFVLGMMHISEKGSQEPFVYSLEHKRDWEKRIRYRLAEEILGPDALEQLHCHALAAFQALDLRDIARIDFRFDETGVPKIIDVNPLPGLSPRYSDIMLLCGLMKRDYPSLVKEIIHVALERVGIK